MSVARFMSFTQITCLVCSNCEIGSNHSFTKAAKAFFTAVIVLV